MFSFLISLSKSQARVIDLNEYNYLDYIGGDLPAFVKFCTPTNPECFVIGDDFWQISELYEGKLNFCSVDCFAHKNLCKNIFDIDIFPTIAFFKNQSTKPVIFKNLMNIDEYVLFLVDYANINPNYVPNLLFEIKPTNFDEWKRSKKCAFAVYYSSMFDHHKKFYNEVRKAAEIFEGEQNITIGIIKCDKYRSLCSKIRDDGYPVAMRYTDGRAIPFNDIPLLKFILSDINDNCDTHRQIDGSLTDDVGVVPEFQKYVKPFVEGDIETKRKLVEELASIDGGFDYSLAMQKMIQENERMEDYLKDLENFYKNKTIRKSQRDILKKTYNIIRVFYPKSPTPTPTPRPAPTLIPNPLKQKGAPIIRPLPINHIIYTQQNQKPVPPKPDYMEL